MKQLLLVFCITGLFNALNAQSICDSLVGNWINVTVKTNDLYFDRNDNAATWQNNVDMYKSSGHGQVRSEKDSLRTFNELENTFNQFRKNGPIKVTFNSDHTYSWHGALYVPGHHRTGTFDCDGSRFLILHDIMDNRLSPMDKCDIKFYDNSIMSVTFLNCSLMYTTFTFKRL